ncbi:MAG TPA: DUF6036 family nucleotidyltransferase [bacterium]|nr:DUF6036 family nucleotidyltransferase [bacterium]
MLNPDYKEMLSALSGGKVEYLIVGAYALAGHGLVRATGDIDIFVRPDMENSKKVYDALRHFGAPLSEIQADTFSQPDIIFQMGVPPRRIDVITSITGVSFQDAWDHRQIRHVEDMDLPVLSIDDLILNKTATGRPKDLVDLEWLKKRKNQK